MENVRDEEEMGITRIPTIKISTAELQDCAEIIQLQKLAYQTEAELYQDWAIPPLTQTPADLQQEFSTSVILKATNNGEILGSVRAKLIDNICHIGRLIVHPKVQKQGIGSALLQEIEKSFVNATYYELFTGSKSERNVRFYLAHDYEISHTKDLSERVRLVYLTKQASK